MVATTPSEVDLVGVDVSKDRLDVYHLGSKKRCSVANDAAGIARLASWAGPKAHLVMEASGGYERLPHRLLTGRGLATAIVNPKRVRDFAKASGRFAKTDRLDAELIARYGHFALPKATPLPDPARRELAEILAFRQRLTDDITARQQQLGHLELPALRDRATADLDRLRQDKAAIEAMLRQAIAKHPDLAQAFTLLTSMPGVGLILAATLMAELPELGTLDRRQVASLVGLAPIAKDSGTMRKRRITADGRSKVRRVLYMATVSISRRSTPVAACYQRLKAKGKPAKVALVAAMRKMIVTLNAIAKSQKPYCIQSPTNAPQPAIHNGC